MGLIRSWAYTHLPFFPVMCRNMKTKVIARFQAGTSQKCLLDTMASLKKDGFRRIKETKASPTTSRHNPTSFRLRSIFRPLGCDSTKTSTSPHTSEKVVADE